MRLRGKSSLLPSLKYFLPAYMSLSTTHPTWTMATTPYQVTKACTVASMLSGRYVTDYRARYWSHTNPEGNCQVCTFTCHPETPGTLEHLLLKCPALADTRTSANSFWYQYLADKPYLGPVIIYHNLTPGDEGDKLFMQLLLDPSSCPMVVKLVQDLGLDILSQLLHMTRTWCYSHHLKHKRLLRLYNVI